jgi:hypothetical protein
MFECSGASGARLESFPGGSELKTHEGLAKSENAGHVTKIAVSEDSKPFVFSCICEWHIKCGSYIGGRVGSPSEAYIKHLKDK